MLGTAGAQAFHCNCEGSDHAYAAFGGMLVPLTFARPSAGNRRCRLRARTDAESSR
jgi:hypothetical protein